MRGKFALMIIRPRDSDGHTSSNGNWCFPLFLWPGSPYTKSGAVVATCLCYILCYFSFIRVLIFLGFLLLSKHNKWKHHLYLTITHRAFRNGRVSKVRHKEEWWGTVFENYAKKSHQISPRMRLFHRSFRRKIWCGKCAYFRLARNLTWSTG